VELKKTEKKKVPIGHKAICFACIDQIQAGRLLKLDKASGTQFISLGQYKAYKSIRKKHLPIKLIDPVPFEESDGSDYSSDNPYDFIDGKKKTPANQRTSNQPSNHDKHHNR
jgi:hypothetical protein